MADTGITTELEGLGFSFAEEDEDKKEPTSSVEADMDALGISFDAGEREELGTEEPGADIVPITSKMDIGKPALESSLDVDAGMATTYDSIYYGGEQGKRLKFREQELYNIISDEFAHEMYSPEEVEKAKAELEKIDQAKQKQYDKVKSTDNVKVSDFGPLGKVINNPDGSKNYVPAPGINEAVQVPLKATTDTLRGLAQTVGADSFADMIPKVSSEDEAVVVVSELAQLGSGAMAGVTLSNKLSKVKKIKEYLPGLSNLLGTAQKGARKIAGKGAISSSAGAAATATEDTGTLYGSYMGVKDLAPEEAKMLVLGESVAANILLKGIGAAGTGIANTSLVVRGVRVLAAGIALISARGNVKKLEEKVVDRIAAQINEGDNMLANATTPEEVEAAYDKLYQAADDITQAAYGKSLNEAIADRAAGTTPDEAMVPTLGEALGEPVLVRQYIGLRNAGGKDRAVEIMREVVENNENVRLDAIIAKGDKLFKEAAPTGKEAAELSRQTAEMQLEKETASILGEREAGERAVQEDVGGRITERTTQRREELQAAEEASAARATQIEAERDQALQARGQQTEQEVGALQQRQAAAEETITAGKQRVADAFNDSQVSTDNLVTLQNLTDESGIVRPISDQLRKDVETKNVLASQMKEEYKAIPVSMGELADILESTTQLATTSNLRSPEAKMEALNTVRDLVKVARKSMEDAAEAGTSQSRAFPEDIEARLVELEKRLNADNLTEREYFDITREMADLMRQSSGGTTTAAGVVEGPTINLNDLLEVQRDAATWSRQYKANSARTDLNARANNEMGTFLGNVADDMNARITRLSENSPGAVEARTQFEDFYRNTFSERWRTETGREWQEAAFRPVNEADILKAEDSILKTLTDVKADRGSIVQIRNTLQGMEPEARQQLSESIAYKVAGDFITRNKTGLNTLTNPETSINTVGRIANSIDAYVKGISRYEEVLPGSTRILREAAADLRGIVEEVTGQVAGAKQAIGEAKEGVKAATAAGTQAEKEIATGAKQALDTEKRALAGTTQEIKDVAAQDLADLTAEQQKRLDDVIRTFNTQRKAIEKSAISRLVQFEGEPADYFTKVLTDTKNGMRDIEELWTRAGKASRPNPETGLTMEQEAIQEAVAEAILTKSITPVTQAKGDAQVALRSLLDVTHDKGTVGNKIFEYVFKDSPEVKQMFTSLGDAAALQRSSMNVRGVAGSQTTPLATLGAGMRDVNMVLFGPLSKKARFANFITDKSLRWYGTEENAGRLYAEILSDGTNAKRVLERAKQLKLEGMESIEDAIPRAVRAVLLANLGYRVEEGMDPMLSIEKNFESYSAGAETEEALKEEPRGDDTEEAFSR
jgi:hypothetical protein